MLTDNAVIEPAKLAWASHIRAYTIDVAAEKEIINHKALHYQLLENGFGIRDATGILVFDKVAQQWAGNEGVTP